MKLPRLAKDRAKQRGMAMFGGSMGAMVDPTQILAAKGNLRASTAPKNFKLLPQPQVGMLRFVRSPALVSSHNTT
jgi:hypothetical protein